MKIIKKILLTFFTSALLVALSPLEVSAFAVGEEFYRGTTQRPEVIPTLQFVYGGEHHNYGSTSSVPIYNATYSGDNTSYNIFCLDPGSPASSNLYISRVLLAGSNADVDYGMASILVAEPSDSDEFQTSGDFFTIAKGFALRIFVNGRDWSLRTSNQTAKDSMEQLFKDFDKEGVYTSSAVSGPEKLIHDAAILYRIGRKAEKEYTSGKKIEIKNEIIPIVSTSEDESQTQNTFNFQEVFEGNTGSPDSGPITQTVHKRWLIKLDLSNFDADEGTFQFDSFEPNNSSNATTRIVGISAEKSDDFSTYTTPLSYNVNVFDTFKDYIITTSEGEKNLTLYIAVESEQTMQLNTQDSCDDNCSQNNAKLKYTYKDPKVLTGAVLYNTQDGKQSGAQRFLVASKTQKQNSEYVEIPIDVCPEKCIQEKCVPIVCEGDVCYPDSTLPQICKDGLTPDEDGLIEYKFLEGYIEGEGYNIKKCLLGGQTDVADNSYKLVDRENANAVAENPYCSIFCREQYSIRVPYKQTVEEGRYFKITLSMKGQQDCYSTEFDTDQFQYDVIAKEKEIIDAINTWNIYYELANGDSTDLVDVLNGEIGCRIATCSNRPSTSSSCSKRSSGYSSSITKQRFAFGNANLTYYAIDEMTGNISTVAVSSSNVLSTVSYPSTTLRSDVNAEYGKVNYDPYTDTTCQSSVSHSCPDPDLDPDEECVTTYSCSPELPEQTCDITTPSVDFNNHIETYKSRLKTAKDNLEDLIEELKEIIDQYNSCVGDKNYQALSEGYEDSAFWNMIYKYDPEIKYSYDEPDPTDTSRDKWINDVKKLSCEDGSCDIMFAKNEEVQAEDCAENSSVKCTSLGSEEMIESVFSETGKDQYVNTYCTGEINDDYSCKSGELHKLDDSTYDDNYFFFCEYNESTGQFDCGSESHPVTNVKYVHKAAVGSGDYDTRLVYYTEHGTGEIKIQYPENPTLNKNYSQVPGVPVSADTPQGTYIYILNIENVGTFYNSGELGRIYSSKSNSLSTYARNLQGSPTVSYPITSGVGSDASDTDKEIAINEYACTYAVSQSSCVDKDGNTHTIDECDIGGKHANWDECKKDICPPADTGVSYCVKEAGAYYVCSSTSYDADKCEKAGSRAEALSKSTVNENCCPNCRAVCVGKCIYVLKNNRTNDGKVQFEFRTVTPQNMNPNDRRLGYNWDSNNPSNSLVAEKASNTIAEIEARSGGKDNENVNISDIPDYVLHVVMTPDMVTWIKEYNNEQQSQGAYSNKSLTCYNYDLDDITDEKTCKGKGYIWQEGTSGQGGKCIMSNVFCYSNFIDELEEKFPNQFDAPHRTEAKNNASSNFETYSGLLNHGTSIITNDYWTIYKYDTLDINGDGVPDIGPSWK